MKLRKSDSASFRTCVYIVSMIFSQGATVIFSPVYTRMLSTSDYGYYSVYLSIINILSIICGMQTYGTLIVKKSELADADYREYNSCVFLLSAISGGVCMLLLFPLKGVLTNMLAIDGGFLLVVGLHAFGVYCVNYMYAYLTAGRKVISYLVLSIVITISVFVGSVVFVSYSGTNKKYMAMYYGNALPYIIAGIIICLLFIRRGQHKNIRSYWGFCIRFSLPLIFHNLAALLLVQADRIMIKQMIGAEEAGIYSICYSMALPMSALWSAMNSAWKTEYCPRLYACDMEYLEFHSKRYLNFYTLATMGFLMIFPEFVKVMTSQEYWEGIFFMPLIIANCYFVFLYSFPANYEFARKKTGGLSIITVTGTVANIALNYWLIPICGMVGAALATLSVQVIIFVAHDVVARFCIGGYHYSWRFYCRGVMPVLLMMAAAYAFMDFGVVRWGLALIIAFAALREMIKNRGFF